MKALARCPRGGECNRLAEGWYCPYGSLDENAARGYNPICPDAPRVECPACSATNAEIRALKEGTVYKCLRCQALFGRVRDLKESYAYVLPVMAEDEVPGERLIYFDFTDGQFRRHGWYDATTLQVVQIG